MGSRYRRFLAGVFFLAATALLGAGTAPAAIDGLVGNSFTLDAGPGYITGGDFNRIFFWGFADGDTGQVQFPGPTLIINQGDNVTVTLRNNLPEPVSIVFPGMENVTASAGVRGPIAAQAEPGGTITYTFSAPRPGTFTYYSGTNIDKQVEMGLYGAILVRPTGYDPLDKSTWRAYNDNGSVYDREFLYLLSEMDDQVHAAADAGLEVDPSTVLVTYWFINGRNFPDTMAEPFAPDFPSQPYNCAPVMHPGDRVLLRFVGGGRDLHPLHTHGNNANIVARNASYYSTGNVVDGYPDLAESSFTVTVAPGQTADAIYEWTGAQIGFDVYGPYPLRQRDVQRRGGRSEPRVRQRDPRILPRPHPAASESDREHPGRGERTVLQRQPVPGRHAAGDPWVESGGARRRLFLHEPLPQRAGDHDQQRLPRGDRHDDGDRSVLGSPERTTPVAETVNRREKR